MMCYKGTVVSKKGFPDEFLERLRFLLSDVEDQRGNGQGGI